jgi:hypothetical protein
LRVEAPLLLAWTMITAALVFGDAEGLLRTTVALTWVAIAPGLALGRLAGFDLVMRLVTAVPVSLCLAAAVSAALIYAGLHSWEVATTVLISITVGAVILRLAPPRVRVRLGSSSSDNLRGKLAEEPRQARLVESLQEGGSLVDAAEAAGVSMSTLRKQLRASDALRRAVEVASMSRVDVANVEPRSQE